MSYLTLPIFVGTLIISTTVILFLAGLLTIYFGEKRTRKGGTYMVAMSFLIISAYLVILRETEYSFSIIHSIVEPAVFFLLAMIIGAAIGLIIFLVILIKH